MEITGWIHGINTRIWMVPNMINMDQLNEGAVFYYIPHLSVQIALKIIKRQLNDANISLAEGAALFHPTRYAAIDD